MSDQISISQGRVCDPFVPDCCLSKKAQFNACVHVSNCNLNGGPDQGVVALSPIGSLAKNEGRTTKSIKQTR